MLVWDRQAVSCLCLFFKNKDLVGYNFFFARYIPDREFDPVVIAKVSSACEGLCRWVRAMDVYDRVIKVCALTLGLKIGPMSQTYSDSCIFFFILILENDFKDLNSSNFYYF